ncbi:MAG: DUF4384 domain-containing protein [Pseudomonadota bacterium]
MSCTIRINVVNHRHNNVSRFSAWQSLCLGVLLSLGVSASASQSSITEADGEACAGYDLTRRQTQEAARAAAKRMAADMSSTHIASTTVVENFELKEDIVKAFNEAEVKILEVMNEQWNMPSEGCYTVRIKAEVTPSNQAMATEEVADTWMANPTLPLNVRLWVNAGDGAYKSGQLMKIYLQGNKPFFARLIYVDATGNRLQLLPNQHRSDNYFPGGTMFEIPTGNDRFELTVGAPFGEEKLILYASTEQLGSIETTPAGDDVYLASGTTEQIAKKTRGVSIGSTSEKPASGNTEQTSTNRVAEFAEATVAVTTAP